MFDVRLKENFKLFISGPSRCGKTFFVEDLLQNIQTFAKQPPSRVIYIYKVWQTKFDEMKNVVHIFMQDEKNIIDKIKEYATGCLLYTSPSPRDQRGSRMPSSA